jgi:hypothetical protein
MGGFALAVLVSLLGVPAGAVPSENIVISGRVRLAHMTKQQQGEIESRKFEVTLRRRNGKTVTAQACLFADLIDDTDWDGGCFTLPFTQGDESIAVQAVSRGEMMPVDQPAQHLLRLLAAEAADQLGATRRVIGFDLDTPFFIQSERFSEADL